MRVYKKDVAPLFLSMLLATANVYAGSFCETRSAAATVTADDELEQPDGVVCELPYSQSFDNENNDYDGKSFVPTGWLSTGTSPFVTAEMESLSAVDGTYYAIAPESSVKRDDRLYTPFFKLEAGVEYTAKFYLYMPGDSDTGYASDFSFTVGTEQDSEFHTALLTKSQYTNSKWTEMTVDYTPDATGYYCFSFALGGDMPLAGEVAVDLFTLKAKNAKSRPVASFSYNGHFNLMDSKLLAFNGTKVKMVNQSTDADTYLWTADGAEPSTSTAESPTFSFPESGTYEVKLTVKNPLGESSATETINVTRVVDGAESLPVSANNPSEDKVWTRNDMPYYETAADADYVTGVNHYYRCLAEKFDVPYGYDYTISSLTYYLCYYGLASGKYNEQAAAPFKLVVYADKDGRPDMDNKYGEFTTTMKDAFGTSGLSKAEMRFMALDKPIVATGPFYVAFEFDKSFVVDEPDTHLTRSIFGMAGFNHRSKQTTFYVLPESLPETATCQLGEYVPVDSVAPEYKGVGLNIVAWMNVQNNGTVSVAMNSDGKVAFAVRMDGDVLTVSGTHKGETVKLTNIAGQTLKTVAAEELSTTVGLGDLPSGVYVVSTKAGTKTVLKR